METVLVMEPHADIRGWLASMSGLAAQLATKQAEGKLAGRFSQNVGIICLAEMNMDTIELERATKAYADARITLLAGHPVNNDVIIGRRKGGVGVMRLRHPETSSEAYWKASPFT